MSGANDAALGRLVNLVVPGGGLILIGHGAMGVAIALLFTATANLGIASALLFPDDVPATWRALCVGAAAGTYLGAQIRYAQTVRRTRVHAAQQRRSAALEAATVSLRQGRVEEAWQALEPLVGQAEDDLALAYRIAQVLTARGDRPAAGAAWRRVRRLDRHRIYRREVIENERVLSTLGGSDSDSVTPGARRD